mgnify:CR=1 FL=1
MIWSNILAKLSHSKHECEFRWNKQNSRELGLVHLLDRVRVPLGPVDLRLIR